MAQTLIPKAQLDSTLVDTTSTQTLSGKTWNGAVIVGQYGGTGVANTGKTITLGGSFTTSGAFTVTLTATAATSVTLPTTGTLATLAGAETLTNKTIGLTGQLSSTLMSSVNSQINTTVQSGYSVATGSNTSVTSGSSSYLLLVGTNGTGTNAMYIAIGGSINMISSVGTEWVAPTTTPAAGKSSIAFNGATYSVYNATGSAQIYRCTAIQF